MKKIFNSVSIVVLSFLGAFALGAQEKTAPSVSYRSETKLSFKSCLFEADRGEGLVRLKENDDKPNIFLTANIYNSGLGEKTSLQLESLKNIFCLPELRLNEENPKIEVIWKSYREIYDEKGKMVDKEEEKSRAKIRQTVLINGEEYTIFLIPQEINTKEHIFKFTLEIYKTQSRKEAPALASMELAVKKEILWNFGGPLAVGFFFNQKAYFLTFTVRVSISSSGPRLGTTGLTWII